MYSGTIISCTTMIALLCVLSSASQILPLVQEIFVEFSFCKKGIETLRNDLIILENSISTIADCGEKNTTDIRAPGTYTERLERISNSLSNEVYPAQSAPSNSNFSMATTMSGFRAGPNGPDNHEGATLIDHTPSFSANQSMSRKYSRIQDWLKV